MKKLIQLIFCMLLVVAFGTVSYGNAPENGYHSDDGTSINALYTSSEVVIQKESHKLTVELATNTLIDVDNDVEDIISVTKTGMSYDVVSWLGDPKEIPKPIIVLNNWKTAPYYRNISTNKLTHRNELVYSNIYLINSRRDC